MGTIRVRAERQDASRIMLHSALTHAVGSLGPIRRTAASAWASAFRIDVATGSPGVIEISASQGLIPAFRKWLASPRATSTVSRPCEIKTRIDESYVASGQGSYYS